MILEGYENYKEKKPRKPKIVKDQECATCEDWLTCPGKPKGVKCVNYKERKPEANEWKYRERYY